MRRERGFQMYHSVLFHHRTDGSDEGIMTVVWKGDWGKRNLGAFLESM